MRFLVEVANSPRWLVASILTVFVGCTAAYAILEDTGPIEAGWWGVVTASTVGYGDQYPETTAGRGVGAVLILSMFLLVMMATAQLTARLVGDPHLFSDAEQEELKADARAAREDAAASRAALERIEASLTGTRTPVSPQP